MKAKSIIMPTAWLLSIAAAYIVGSKITSPEQDSAKTDEKSASARPSYRSHTNASSSSSRKKNTSHRSSASATGDSLQDIASIMRQGDPVVRFTTLLDFINRLGPNDFPEAAANFRALDITNERMSEYSLLLHSWAKLDPLEALDYAEKNTGSDFARQTILASWAADNPSAALQWAEAHHEGEGANPWLASIVRGVVTKNPQRASEIMATMPYGRKRGEALLAIIPHIARDGQEKATQWLETITDERLRIGATGYLANRLAHENPESTATWVDSITDQEARSRAIREVADAWADKDVSSAVAWAETLRGDDKTRAATQIIGEYARKDAAKASEWLDSLTGSDGYEGIAWGFISSTAPKNPELALAKVPTLKDPKLQNRYYGRILSHWHQNDAAAAKEWMTSNNIPEEIQRRATRQRD